MRPERQSGEERRTGDDDTDGCINAFASLSAPVHFIRCNSRKIPSSVRWRCPYWAHHASGVWLTVAGTIRAGAFSLSRSNPLGSLRSGT